MDHTKQHLAILRQAATTGLPKSIDESTAAVPIRALGELLDAGLVKAIDASSFDGPAYLEPQITLAGREYLTDLERRIAERSFKGRATKASIFVAGALTTALVQLVARLLMT